MDKTKQLIKSLGMDCPKCDTGLLITKVRKNWYHGKKSNCRKTRWRACHICGYNKFVEIVK